MSTRKITVIPEDWKIPLPERVDAWTSDYFKQRGIHPEQRGEDGKLVAVQLRGSGAMKSLPPDVVFKLIGMLRDAGHQVILIENEEPRALKYAFDDDTHYMVGRDVLHGISALRLVDLAITMDSGPLWMAHIAACPTLVILGPTRPQERITYHPLYPDQARAVCLNDLIDCPACFERADACAQQFRCMQQQPDWGRVVEMILGEAASILAGESAPVPLPVASNQA